MDLLQELQQIPGPSGDEGQIADFVETWCDRVPGVNLRRFGDLLLAVRGKPRVAVFSHLDTVGFTQGYDHRLIPIGAPHVEGEERLRRVGCEETTRLRLKLCDDNDKPVWTIGRKKGAPGARWVYADPLMLQKDKITGPYLDNRAGVWNAMRTLEACEDVAVLFTTGEEHSGRGAAWGARLAYEELNITRALISDITWHTDWIKCGKGPAISFRDRSLPRQRFLEAVLAAAEESGVPFQREVESSGGSDGSVIDRMGYPLDWVFVGAPEKHAHTPREQCRISDLYSMTELYRYLVPALSRLEMGTTE